MNFQLLTELLQQLTALLHNGVMPLLRELTFDALVVAGLIQAWRRIFRRQRPPPRPPPDDHDAHGPRKSPPKGSRGFSC